jgi:hypothetical protein
MMSSERRNVIKYMGLFIEELADHGHDRGSVSRNEQTPRAARVKAEGLRQLPPTLANDLRRYTLS